MTEPTHDISVEGFIESFDRRYPTFILKTLLCDRTTGCNIIWADNEYEALGDGYMGDDEITVEKITGMNSGVIKPRIAKEQEKQSQRTKSRAEVFTPSWLCNQMNNDLDETWFGQRDIFNTETVADNGANTWTTTDNSIEFPKSKGRGWRAYVEAPRLEITCGEAPFVCSRYDTVTGDELPVGERVGFLDRKLRVVTEKTKTRKEWVRRALDALRATYGFEYQGDNLLIARINVLETFAEHLRNRWGSDPQQDELEQAAWIVSWNFWQMNGFTDAVPTNKMGAEVESTLGTFEEPEPEPIQPSLSDLFDDVFPDETTEETNEEEPKETVPLCVIYDWQNGEPFEFASLKGKAAAMGKKFYAVIGNPPYQESRETTKDMPVYNVFMDAAYEVSDRVELITPARFLFNAGATPKTWNQAMLSDEHFKVLHYEPDSSKVFCGAEIKGGVAIHYRDSQAILGPIDTFTSYPELNSISQKVKALFISDLGSIMYPYSTYTLANRLWEDFPNRKAEVEYIAKNRNKLSKDEKEGKLSNLRIITTNIFDLLALPNWDENLFFDAKPNDEHEYCRILGRANGQRCSKWIRSSYIDLAENYNKYKVLITAVNGSGKFGETLSTPIIGTPELGYTQTFLGIGSVDSEEEAQAIYKYICTKFVRAMLGVLKITQHNPPEKWKFVPLQDFTVNSDIDWTQSVADIDRQLYAKYGLDEEEIEFIESHVKEMD